MLPRNQKPDREKIEQARGFHLRAKNGRFKPVFVALHDSHPEGFLYFSYFFGRVIPIFPIFYHFGVTQDVLLLNYIIHVYMQCKNIQFQCQFMNIQCTCVAHEIYFTVFAYLSLIREMLYKMFFPMYFVPCGSILPQLLLIVLRQRVLRFADIFCNRLRVIPEPSHGIHQVHSNKLTPKNLKICQPP